MKKSNLAAILVLSTTMTIAETPAKHTAKAAKLTPEEVHRGALVVDTHEDTPQRFVDDGFDLSDPLNGGQLNLDAIHKGNLGASFMSIWVEPDLFKGHYARRTLELIDASRQQAAKHPDQIKFATSAADIEAAHREHKYAMLMGIEGGHSIEDSLGLLRMYYDLGVRYMTLTWSNSNGWADSSGDDTDISVPHTQTGLSEFGKDVVYEMNRLGMMVDISHVSDKTFYRTLIITRAPVIASHSAARALCDAPRNMTDDMLRQVTINGGVVMVNFYSGFISQAYRDAQRAQKSAVDKATADLKAKFKAEGKEITYSDLEKLQRQMADSIPRPPLSALIDQIDHIAKVAGIDHVGLGSDFDGVSGQLPEGIDSAADLPKITAELMKRGYTADDCRKILGGNFMRVFKQVEAISKQLQAESRPKITEKQPFDKPLKKE
ncbi:MAG TPA: dipeptidase [Acidobacteriaceae bacterium]|jgi:membrane dipeptidase|nr:dipeptidase [Acidobacteriaceae bacterium]